MATKDIYRKNEKQGANLVASVQGILSDLSSWLQSLPPELRLDFTRLEQNISRELVSLFLFYYQCINMTVRPLLFFVVQKRLRTQPDVPQGKGIEHEERLSETTMTAIKACIKAACDSTMVIAAAMKQNLVGMCILAFCSRSIVL
jgi:hypothetical protein